MNLNNPAPVRINLPRQPITNATRPVCSPPRRVPFLAAINRRSPGLRHLLLLLALLPMLTVAVRAQFTFTENNGVLILTGLSGFVGGELVIPSAVSGEPVSRIGSYAFEDSHLTSVIIPDGITSIGDHAFINSSVTSVIIPDSVATIEIGAFDFCDSLTNAVMGSGVRMIGDYAFFGCSNLPAITIPSSLTHLGSMAFYGCASLTGAYFKGNAPSGDSSLFGANINATVYYRPGTMGWGPTFGERPTALWSLPNPLILKNGPSFGVRTNRFGFIISWATNRPVVVEASTILATPVWSPVATNALTGGWSYFSDPQWANYLSRIYRVRSQ